MDLVRDFLVEASAEEIAIWTATSLSIFAAIVITAISDRSF
jgi:hypothetical protein